MTINIRDDRRDRHLFLDEKPYFVMEYLLLHGVDDEGIFITRTSFIIKSNDKIGFCDIKNCYKRLHFL